MTTQYELQLDLMDCMLKALTKRLGLDMGKWALVPTEQVESTCERGKIWVTTLRMYKRGTTEVLMQIPGNGHNGHYGDLLIICDTLLDNVVGSLRVVDSTNIVYQYNA